MDAEAVKALALEVGFDLVGITGPQAGHPLPWTRSVVVVGLATLDEAFDYEMRIAYEGKRRWYKPIYTALEALAARLAVRLRAQGWQAEHLTFEDSIAYIDVRVAAVAAGLGVRGRNNLVVTRQYGPQVRFGAVFTSAELARDHPLQDYYCPSCTLCWNACPTGAIGPGGFVRDLCLGEFHPTREMAARQERELHRPSPATRLQCIACLTACPIGRKVTVETWHDIRDE
ncbi:MAG: epoxyqueuosine reductase [Anaerolineae bacterium]|nr:epoxyqueuosine reductase [Anaerolineae bacterium]